MVIVDFHLHPAFTVVPEDSFIKELDSARVDVGVLLAIDVDHTDLDKPNVKSMLLQCLLDAHIWDLRSLNGISAFLRAAKISNELVASLVAKYPGRFVGFGSINVSKGKDYVEKKLAELDRLKLQGVKLIPTLQFFDPIKSLKILRKILGYCERREKLAVFHTGCDPYVWEIPEFSSCANPKRLEPLIREFESVPIILAHMGCYSAKMPGIWFEEALELGEKYGNVWFDIAAVTYVITHEGFVEKIRRSIGMDRLLFGSDYPVVHGVSIRQLIAEIADTRHLTGVEKDAILGGNATKLLKAYV
jgi:hypothetical protein